ncbi:MAG: tryptophan-rich sensory protein [Hyphomicrobiaceae bacterium]|nr:tryptophan-rich sensory protein [Hyphomicrobiaceae bacterium]
MDTDRRPPDRHGHDGRDHPLEPADAGSIARTGDDVIALTTWVVVCFGAGILGSFATPKAAVEWYPSLVKPWFTPPGTVFAPIWTVLYLMMAVAVWRVGRAGAADAARRAAVGVFAVQLALNMGWSWAFFAGRSPGLALAVILVLLDCVVLVYWRFSRIDELAGRLILPYLGWVGFAALLNLAIVLANR